MLRRILEIDESLSNQLRLDNQQGFLWKATTLSAHSGDSWYWVFVLGILWLFVKPLHKISAFLILSIVFLAVLVMVIKLFTRRRRPPGEWGTIYRNTDPHSFPSGHAARAFMLAVITLELAPIGVGILALVWAILVSLSRIMTGMHYLSDVLAGAGLGAVIATLFVALRPAMESTLFFLF